MDEFYGSINWWERAPQKFRDSVLIIQEEKMTKIISPAIFISISILMIISISIRMFIYYVYN
jgi:hypothetical protein